MEKNIYGSFGISDKNFLKAEKVLSDLKERFEEIDETAEYNQMKVLRAMQKFKLSEADLQASTGYGYNDSGRETLENVYAGIFGAESALVRPSLTCGTHALTIALSALTRPGDEIFSPVGKPYDTLLGVIGIREQAGSLSEYGITYNDVSLLQDGSFDFDGIKNGINERTKLVTIQRSKGYDPRPTLSVEKIGELCRFIRSVKSDVIIMVDNCYGEFTEKIEPTEVGADLAVGSLIKNPGGGLAPIGGYIVGRKDLIELCAYRLTAPGLGKEVGATLGLNRSFFQGLFLSPTVTAGAVKGAIFAAKLFGDAGFECIPGSDEKRYDIIQAIKLKSAEGMLAFCKGIQAAAPVDSHVTPVPWDMPGYGGTEVIMAAGAFISGSSIELSADGPVCEPYEIYFQGGLTWYHAKLGILKAFQEMDDAGLL